MSSQDLQLALKTNDKAPVYEESELGDYEPSSEVDSYVPEHDRDDWQVTTVKKPSKTVSFSKITRSRSDELAMKRHDLELKLAGTQLEEAARMDEHRALHCRFSRIEDLLQALLTFLDCVLMQNKSSQRLCQQINEFVVHDAPEAVTEEVSNIIKRSIHQVNSRELQTIKHKIVQILQDGKRIQELTSEYQNRSKDYALASQNFKALLENAELSSKQFNHLQRQYEGILLNLQHSRCILDQELPAVISNFMAVLATAFECVSKHYDLINESAGDVFKLMQNLANTLEENGLSILKRNFKDLRGVEPRCSCSKKISTEDK